MASTRKTAKKTPAKKKGLSEDEKWAVGELEIIMLNDKSLYYHLTSNWYNSYAKKKAKGTYDRDAALKGLAGTFTTQAVSFYNRKYGKYGRTIRLSKEAKAEFAKRALRELNESGLKNIRKGSKPRERENPTVGTRDNIWHYLR